MPDSGWSIGLITGGTAIVASWVTGRGATKSARVQAEVTAHAAQVAEARSRRPDAYREMSVALEGPAPVAEAAQILRRTAIATNGLLGRPETGGEEEPLRA
ncbi:hypothetical protein ACWDHW_09760 [Streptomyces melanosporofaciens]|uniref:hypothetical protein n=1 Tax=unclassified Streptomyces TaxID=2593676 RepID=UPI0037ABE208